jgi:hypothetical protein
MLLLFVSLSFDRTQKSQAEISGGCGGAGKPAPPHRDDLSSSQRKFRVALDKLAIRMNRRFIVSDNSALTEEFGLVRSLSLSSIVEASSEEGEAHGGDNTYTDHCDGETDSQHSGSPFNGVIFSRIPKAASRRSEELRKN